MCNRRAVCGPPDRGRDRSSCADDVRCVGRHTEEGTVTLHTRRFRGVSDARAHTGSARETPSSPPFVLEVRPSVRRDPGTGDLSPSNSSCKQIHLGFR